ncbi:MAG: hypothetical protein NTX15_04550 [Candidatus Kapabacteria bacterium]|nr:hypothetical protein [Candidatus Kapabacteria bacterium]
MSLWFHVQGAGRLLARRRGPVLRMMVVAAVGTIWCLAGATLGVSVWRDLDRRAQEMTIDVIGPNDSTNQAINAMAMDMRRRPSVASVTLMNGEAVWREFSHDMHLESDDLRDVAAVPTILRIHLRPVLVSMSSTDRFVRSLREMYPEATSDVVWPKPYVEMIDASRRSVLVFGIVAGLLSLVLFLIAAAYAFRAEIHRAGSDLNVAALLGASVSWIAAPHLLVSLVAGAVGLLIGVGVVLVARPYAYVYASWLEHVSVGEILLWAALVGILGLALSWWQSFIGVKGASRLR